MSTDQRKSAPQIHQALQVSLCLRFIIRKGYEKGNGIPECTGICSSLLLPLMQIRVSWIDVIGIPSAMDSCDAFEALTLHYARCQCCQWLRGLFRKKRQFNFVDSAEGGKSRVGFVSSMYKGR